MADCDKCGSVDELTRACEYCGCVYCPKHMLPERHNCAGLRSKDSISSPTDDVTLGKDDGSDSAEAQPSSTETPEKPNLDDTEGSSDQSSSPQPSQVGAESSTAAPSSTPDSELESGPDVKPDGSLYGRNQATEESGDTDVNRLRRALTGITEDARYHGQCPYCDNYTGRKRGRRIVECDECGWRPGLPLLRYRKYPNWGAINRRTKATLYTFLQLTIIACVGLVLISATVGTGISAIDTPVDRALQSVTGGSDPQTSTAGQSGSNGDNGETNDGGVIATELNTTLVEREIHNAINDRRAERGLSQLDYDAELATIAQNHSDDMATNDFLSHTGSDGSTMEDRYQQAGYDCQVPTGNGGYATGAENVAQTWYRTEIEGGEYYSSAEDLAEGIVEQWMASAGHRENIVQEYWRMEGIGVTVTENNEVYATQNFC